jgi:hypothetical protein
MKNLIVTLVALVALVAANHYWPAPTPRPAAYECEIQNAPSDDPYGDAAGYGEAPRSSAKAQPSTAHRDQRPS